MAKQTEALPAASGEIRFTNGTTLSGLHGVGVLRQRTRNSGALRSASLPAEIDTTAQFDQALADCGIIEQETLVVEAAQVGSTPNDVVTLSFGSPPQAAGRRIVLYQDESGGLSWHLEEAARHDRSGLRSAAKVSIPLRTAAVLRTLSAGVPVATFRGPLTVVGRKIFKVLVLPAASALLQTPTEWFASQIERRCSRNLIWAVTPENFRSAPTLDLSDKALLSGGPVLLLIHGIFSSVEGMLAGLPSVAMEAWHQRYGGRVIAFNHLTASVSPEDNARDFLQRLQQLLPDTPVTFDILCHSRGGIVARTLAERARKIAPETRCHIRSVYFVASPNSGSALGDADHMTDMIDTFTNCLASLPDGPVSYAIEVVVGLVMLLGNAVVNALPGIAAMATRFGYIEDVLNASRTPSPAIYGAAASNFEPHPGRDNAWFIDRLANPVMDRVFTINGVRTPNDVVVPQQGVFARNGHPSFPIKHPLVYEAEDGVWHTAFFSQPRTIAAIEDFFGGVAARAEADELAQYLGEAHGAPAGFDEIVADDSAFSGGDAGNPVPPPTSNTPPLVRGGFRGATPQPVGQPLAPAGAAERAGPEATVPPAQTLPLLPTPDAFPMLPLAATHDVLLRSALAEFPDTVAPASIHDFLVVLANVSTTGTGKLIRFPISVGADSLEVTAFISAPGFTIMGPRQANLTLHRHASFDGATASFRLAANAATGGDDDQRTIDVSFWLGNDCVGGVKRSCLVSERRPDSEPPSTDTAPGLISIDPKPRQSAELSLYVRRVSKDTFQLSAGCAVPLEDYPLKDFGIIDLDGKELAQFIAAVIEPPFAAFPGQAVPDDQYEAAVTTWNRTYMQTVADFGRQLWLLLPEAFRLEYLRLAGLPRPPRSISIYSDDLAFPWELVVPFGMVSGVYKDLDSWGKAHILGRWRPAINSRPQPQTTSVRKMSLVVTSLADSGLSAAEQEADAIARLFPFAKRVTPVSRSDMDSLLGSNDVQWVHFSGHGTNDLDNADLSYLELDGAQRLPAMAFAGGRLAATSHPVLYLNACSVGRAGRKLGRPCGFAANCIDSGWSGVVAPYWPVYDRTAAEFAEAFYGKVGAGIAIGEALQQLRVERPDDPTTQAYAYFGDPFARFQFG